MTCSGHGAMQTCGRYSPLGEGFVHSLGGGKNSRRHLVVSPLCASNISLQGGGEGRHSRPHHAHPRRLPHEIKTSSIFSDKHHYLFLILLLSKSLENSNVLS